MGCKYFLYHFIGGALDLENFSAFPLLNCLFILAMNERVCPAQHVDLLVEGLARMSSSRAKVKILESSR